VVVNNGNLVWDALKLPTAGWGYCLMQRVVLLLALSKAEGWCGNLRGRSVQDLYPKKEDDSSLIF